MRTVYKVRAYPDVEQAALLRRTFGCVRVVWNKTLADRQARYATERKSTSYKETDAAFSEWKRTGDRHERGLRRQQRRLCWMRKGSQNRAKQRVTVAREHSRVRDARRDLLHKISTGLVRRFDVIAVEDLAPRNMVRNRRLAKSISEVSWGEFRAMLEYKAERAGRRVAVIDRWYPSSKTCSSCGHLLATVLDHDKECAGCRVLDRNRRRCGVRPSARSGARNAP